MVVTVLTLRKWDGGWQDQGQVLSEDLGPIASPGLGAWLKAEAHCAGRWSRPRPSTLQIGPPGGAGAAVSPPSLSGDAAPHPWPGRLGGVASARPRHQSLAGLGGKPTLLLHVVVKQAKQNWS